MVNPDENITALQRQEFTQVEIERLFELRRALWEKQVQQTALARRRLEFVRWLFKTGRITEHIV